MTFKVGDKVKVVAFLSDIGYSDYCQIGDVGTYVMYDENALYGYKHEVAFDRGYEAFIDGEIELVVD